ncbi:MAG: lamin tail domain-containing protein [Nannocystaceae bacterium]
MSITTHTSAGHRGRALVMGLLACTSGCFQDQFMEPSSQSTAGSSTAAADGSEDGTDASDGTTGATSVAPGSTSDSPGSTGISLDGSTGADGSSDDDGSSTGVVLDGSTGETILGVDDLLPGDLVITEIMWNPDCSLDNCEWVEILNATDSTVNLVNLYLQDIDYNTGNQGRVTLDVIVPPGEVAVIARSLSFWPYDFEPDATYGPNPGLNNNSPDRVVLRSELTIIDESASTFIDQEQGIAWALSGDLQDAVSNDVSTSWCEATAPLLTVGGNEYGTPGQLNPPC